MPWGIRFRLKRTQPHLTNATGTSIRMEKLHLLQLLALLLLAATLSGAYRLPFLSRRLGRRRKGAPVVQLPRLDTAFELKPQQRAVQAKGWKESLSSIGNLLISADKPPTRAQKETVRSIGESLETVSSMRKPAYSPKVGGQWALLYSNSPGVSSGRLGPFTGRVYQDVDLAAKEYVNILEVGGKRSQGKEPWLTARLVATWEIVDDSTWEVFFDYIEVELNGRRLFRQKFKNVSRYWQMTYLDDDIRIMRGRRPERTAESAYLFVLKRDNGQNR